MSDCIFCRIVRGEVPSERVYEDEQVVAFRDVNPQAPVHILVVPREHLVNALALGEPQKELAGHLILVANELARREGIAESGYRLVLNCNRDGGQSVDHLHLHLLGGRPMGWPPG